MTGKRFDRLIDDLMHASQGMRRLPVVRPRDAEAVCELLHAQLDVATARRAALVVADGHTIACGPGCSACCNNIPAVHDGESITIVRWLSRPENRPVRDAFLARFEGWRAGVGDLVDQWIAASTAGDADAGVRAAIEAMRRNTPCAFLDDGRCSIYPVRPVACREHHAIDTAAGCLPDPVVQIRQAKIASFDAFIEKIRPLLLVLHDALTDRRGARPVCQAVHDDLP